MEIEKNVYYGRLYKVRSLYTGGIIGGPLVTAIVMSHNFRVLGDRKKARLTWLFFILFFAGFVVATGLVPELAASSGLISLAVSIILMNKYQSAEIENYKAAGYEPYSNWRAFFIGLLCLAFVCLLIMLEFYLVTPEHP